MAEPQPQPPESLTSSTSSSTESLENNESSSLTASGEAKEPSPKAIKTLPNFNEAKVKKFADRWRNRSKGTEDSEISPNSASPTEPPAPKPPMSEDERKKMIQMDVVQFWKKAALTAEELRKRRKIDSVLRMWQLSADEDAASHPHGRRSGLASYKRRQTVSQAALKKDAVMSGYVAKKKRKSLTRWHQRYMILVADTLYYFGSENIKRHDRPKQIIDLYAANVKLLTPAELEAAGVHVSESKSESVPSRKSSKEEKSNNPSKDTSMASYRYGFEITHPDGSYVFLVRTESEQKEWVQAIQSSISYLQNPLLADNGVETPQTSVSTASTASSQASSAPREHSLVVVLPDTQTLHIRTDDTLTIDDLLDHLPLDYAALRASGQHPALYVTSLASESHLTKIRLLRNAPFLRLHVGAPDSQDVYDPDAPTGLLIAPDTMFVHYWNNFLRYHASKSSSSSSSANHNNTAAADASSSTTTTTTHSSDATPIFIDKHTLLSSFANRLFISNEENTLRFGKEFSLKFKRTCRRTPGDFPPASAIPVEYAADPAALGLPRSESLGDVAVFNVADFGSRVPAKMAKAGGVIVPLFQSEALWLYFTSCSPHAVKVAVSKTNAFTRTPYTPGFAEGSAGAAGGQDYMVVPLQHWVGGVDHSPSHLRQITPLPTNAEFKKDELPGMKLQILVAPLLRTDVRFTPSLLWNAVAASTNGHAAAGSGRGFDLFTKPAKMALRTGDVVFMESPVLCEAPALVSDYKLQDHLQLGVELEPAVPAPQRPEEVWVLAHNVTLKLTHEFKVAAGTPWRTVREMLRNAYCFDTNIEMNIELRPLSPTSTPTLETHPTVVPSLVGKKGAVEIYVSHTSEPHSASRELYRYQKETRTEIPFTLQKDSYGRRAWDKKRAVRVHVHIVSTAVYEKLARKRLDRLPLFEIAYRCHHIQYLEAYRDGEKQYQPTRDGAKTREDGDDREGTLEFVF